MVPIKCASVLRDHIELSPERRKCPAVDRMTMRSAEDIRTGTVDRAVDREGGGIEEAHRSRLREDSAVVCDEEEV